MYNDEPKSIKLKKLTIQRNAHTEIIICSSKKREIKRNIYAVSSDTTANLFILSRRCLRRRIVFAFRNKVYNFVHTTTTTITII